MLTKCKLNNKSMRNARREQGYQAIVIDLALLGILEKAEAELLIGGSIPAGLTLPDGSSALAESDPEAHDLDDEGAGLDQEEEEVEEPDPED